MTITTTALTNYLKRYNEWRRGADTEPPDPSELGEVIDAACDKLEELEKDKERLDWLIDNASISMLRKDEDGEEWWVELAYSEPRSDIDKAMEEHYEI